MDRTWRFVWVVLGLVTGCAAEVLDAPDDGEGDGESVVVIDDAKLDAADVRVRADGLTVWIDPVIEGHVEDDGAPRFVVSGRASRDVLEVAPERGVGRVISARRFEVELDGAAMSELALGAPLDVVVRAARAPHARYVVRLRGRARIGAGSGAREVMIASDLAPVWSEGEARWRGALTLGAELSDARLVWPELALVPDEDVLRFELPWAVIARGASERGARMVIEAQRRGGTLRRTAELDLAVSEIAITHGAFPEETCAPECRTGDASACGEAWRVARCRTLEARFADDLRAHLVGWYALHEMDVRAAGGASLEDARCAIAASRVEEITLAEEDPHGHDLATTRVLRHEDVVFPGSDVVWHGAYDRETGARVEIYAWE